MRIHRLAAARTVRRQAARPAVPACGQEAARPSSPGSRRHQPPLPLPAGVRTQQPPQSRPHADQRVTVHEPLKILSLCLRKEQRIQDQALVFLPHVVHTAPRPGHMQRQLNLAGSRPPQVFQRRRQAARVRAPARRQSTSVHADNYSRSACREQQARRAPYSPRPTNAAKSRERQHKQIVSPAQRLYLRMRSQSTLPPSSPGRAGRGRAAGAA